MPEDEITRTKILGKGTPLWKALLFERRIPWRYHDRINGIKFRLKTKKILNTKPIKLNTDSDVEIHMLLNKDHICMALFTLKSFLRFYNKVNVTIHGDGSLDLKSKNILKKHIPGIRIISLKHANHIMMNIDPMFKQVKQNVSRYFRLFSHFRQVSALSFGIFSA